MRLLYLDIDTLRADHLGVSGYDRNTSPNIDALAGDGIRFTDCYASDVPCLPSRTALMSGMFGIRNGVINHGGLAADLRPLGESRGFQSKIINGSFASKMMMAGWRTASISSFPLRHSASWWTGGFLESLNLMRGFGIERADEVLPHAHKWLDENGAADDWFLHVHLWDPHTPYNTPAEYDNVFEGDPIPDWLTEDVRSHHWTLPGPHSAQEVMGYLPDEYGMAAMFPRQPTAASDMDEVKRIIDGYDLGIRYADDALGALLTQLDALGVLDDTAIMVSSDHGEAFGELGVYCDHQAADEATTHIPFVLKWPGLEPRVQEGLHYQIDLTRTVIDLLGLKTHSHWDGVSIADELRSGAPSGRDQLVVSQGAWGAQRSVRWDNLLYSRTFHDCYHGWNDEMLFDLAADPHQQHDLATEQPTVAAEGARRLDAWTAEQLDGASTAIDPMQIVLDEGGPFHTRGHLPEYIKRLEETGRGEWVEFLRDRHPQEFANTEAATR